MTKIILSGASTPAGLTFLRTAMAMALLHVRTNTNTPAPEITHILALTLESLPEDVLEHIDRINFLSSSSGGSSRSRSRSSNPKQHHHHLTITVVLDPDFEDFRNILPHIDGVRYDACVWCLGHGSRGTSSRPRIRKGGLRFSSEEEEDENENERANNVIWDHTFSAAEVFSESYYLHSCNTAANNGHGDIEGQEPEKEQEELFKFIYLSIDGADPVAATSKRKQKQKRKPWTLRALWSNGDEERVREREMVDGYGRVESALFALSKGYEGEGENEGEDQGQGQAFELYTFRPGEIVDIDLDFWHGVESSSGLLGLGLGLGLVKESSSSSSSSSSCSSSSSSSSSDSGGSRPRVRERVRGFVMGNSKRRCPASVLGAALVGVAVEGFGERGVSVFFENREILEVGREMLGGMGMGMGVETKGGWGRGRGGGGGGGGGSWSASWSGSGSGIWRSGSRAGAV
ncbi:hypothetical protein DFH27DRAFT_527828 [Peziza echinospora]|nr:hypothetical protein DFH27DRAFT_527828 [Peziza echinospora]